MDSPKKCFVIMPFSKTESHSKDYWTKHFKRFLKPNIEKVEGVKAFRSEPLRGNIANEIIINLIKGYIVVADLTDHNPNVLWELGVRQSFKNRTITIAESKTQIPFHFSHKGVFYYDPNHLEDEPFLSQFTSAIKDCLLNPENPDSPVLEIITQRGTLYQLMLKEENKRRIDALCSECQKNEHIIKKIYRTIEKPKNSSSHRFYARF